MCINHPWRHAYAKCNYCKRPFCYADLVEYSGLQFCLEDASKAGTTPKSEPITPNRFTYLSSLIFLGVSIAVLYYTYPQIGLLFTTAYSGGIQSIPLLLTYSYAVVLFTTVFIALGIISSILVLSNSAKLYYASAMILVFMLLFFMYEYLTTATTSSNYLFYVNIALFCNMLVLALDRFSYMGTSSERATLLLQLPKIETL